MRTDLVEREYDKGNYIGHIKAYLKRLWKEWVNAVLADFDSTGSSPAGIWTRRPWSLHEDR
jgi:hypothetical protein